VKPILIFAWVFLFISCNNQIPYTVKTERNHFLDQAYEFQENNEFDSAFVYFEKSRSLFLKNNDSIGVARSLINMAITQNEFGDYYGSEETSTKALEFLNLRDTNHYSLLSAIYSNLSSVSEYLRDSEKSIEYAKLSIFYVKDSTDRKVYKNNLALSYIEQNELNKAKQIFEEIIPVTEVTTINYARFLTNYARVKFMLDSTYNPIPEMKEGLRIRQEKQDLWGLNSSYGNISKYYLTRNKDSAIFYTDKQVEISKRIKSPEAIMSSLQRLLSLTIDKKDKAVFDYYRSVEDSVELARLTAKNQFALIRYEVEKNKTNNLLLQNEIAEKQYNLNLQRILLITLLIVIGLSTYYAWNWYKRRKQRLELESDNKIKENQLKTSRKVHDVVANGIYRVMAELENMETIDREELLDRLEIMYDKSRDISYEVEDAAEEEIAFNLTISDLLKSFSNEERTVLIAGNDQTVWDLLNKHHRNDIEQVLQELMVNMQKHSKASEVVIRFGFEKSQISIFYKDNGVGLSEEIKFGNGLRNTETRINNLRGTLIFEKKSEEGLGIQIKIPINK